MALYHVLVYAKGMERLDSGTRDEVQRRYLEEAPHLLRACEGR